MPSIPLRDGHALHVRTIGRGQPVLMLPGLGMSSSHWLPFLLPYLHRFRFYLPDFRGFGRSAHLRLNQADVFRNHMEDVQDVIAHFGLRDFLLTGYSLGGSTALHLLHEHGFEGVKRYLHIDQSPCVGNREGWPHGLFGERQDELFAGMRRLQAVLDQYPAAAYLNELPAPSRRDVAVVMAEVFSLMGGRPAMEPLLRRLLAMPGMASRLLPLSRLDDARRYLAAYSAGGHDYRESLSRCSVPVTVMVGMRSPLYPPAGQMAMADYAPRARIVRFEKSGHVPLMDEPLRFTRELGNFLYGR
ncbi:MAG: alpha/beta hydrolase [Moraxellaceae bacterium]|nr:alpha/beta hydrolase [Moraxellaceae bacterium]